MVRLYIFSLFFVVCNVVCAATLEVSPGRLCELVGGSDDIDELILTGSADASDFYFLVESMPALRRLDIGGLTIMPYYGKAIGGCESFEGALVPAVVFAGSSLRELVLPAGVRVGDFAFSGSALRSVAVGDGAELMSGAFSNCEYLSDLSLGRCVAVGDAAFQACASLSALNLNGALRVGDAAFAACASLERVDGAEALCKIGSRAFMGCVSLSSFEFGAALSEIGEYAFSESGLEEADLSACAALKHVGGWIMSGSASLASAAFYEGLADIGTGVLFGCSALCDVKLPQSLASLQDYALANASSLCAVELPAALAEIGDSAMEGAAALRAIDAAGLSAVPVTGADVWRGVPQSEVVLSVGENMAQPFSAADQWREFSINEVPAGIGSIDKAESNIAISFSGESLLVESATAELALVELFNMEGVLLMRASVSGHRAVVDTEPLGGSLFIVRCECADGARSAAKLARLK